MVALWTDVRNDMFAWMHRRMATYSWLAGFSFSLPAPAPPSSTPPFPSAAPSGFCDNAFCALCHTPPWFEDCILCAYARSSAFSSRMTFVRLCSRATSAGVVGGT